MNAVATNIWIRYILPFLLAVVFGVLVTLQSLFKEPIGWAWYGLIWMTVTTYLIWEANLRIGAWLDKRLEWNAHFFRRLGLQLAISYAASILLFLLSYIGINWYENQVLHLNNALSPVHLAAATIMGFMLTTFINVVQIGYQLIQVRERERLRAERYQRESVSARLESLRQQIDPHFLFNNFSTLYSLIYEDQERAGSFLLKLSDIYRLVLEYLDREWVSLSEELELVRAYLDLLTIRYGSALKVTIDLPESTYRQQVIPFALQLLVENAIKHNQIDAEHPLQIHIGFDPDRGIVVENNLMPRSSVPVSGKIGLKNLEERYRFRLGQSIRVMQDRKHFRVIIPLFQA